MKVFVIIINAIQASTIFIKSSILDFRQGTEYISVFIGILNETRLKSQFLITPCNVLRKFGFTMKLFASAYASAVMILKPLLITHFTVLLI